VCEIEYILESETSTDWQYQGPFTFLKLAFKSQHIESLSIFSLLGNQHVHHLETYATVHTIIPIHATHVP
ncbi:hypothetical protein L9F63_013969, partial [Diploptera punctata]